MAALTLSIATTAILVCIVNGQTDYCSISPQHTMCKYQPEGCEEELLVNQITAADKRAILTTHNKLRSKVANGNEEGQPTASNMREIKWSNELATIAQRWTDQCTVRHDTNRNTANNKWVGQNIVLNQSTRDKDRSANFTKAILMLYDEVTDPGFNPSHIDPFVLAKGVGHYTQIVWAETDRIGCGYAYYKAGQWYNKLYICNYSKGGNVKGGQMYRTGDPASDCQGGQSSVYPGLCAS